MNYQYNIYIYGFLFVALIVCIILGIVINIDAKKNPLNAERASRYNKKILILSIGAVVAFVYTFLTGQY